MPKYLLLELAGTLSIFKRMWRSNNKVYSEAYFLKHGAGWTKLQTFMPSISYGSLRSMGAKPITKEELALILLDN